MVSRKSLEGLVFNDITIVKYLYTNKLNKSVYLCYCSCGKFKEIVGSAVKSGNTKSCGCKQFEHSTTHGLTNHPLYQKWADMKTRCLNPNNEYYYRYGGR